MSEIDLLPVAVENAALKGGCGHNGLVRQCRPEAVPFRVHKEEGLVFDEGAAERSAELVADEGILRIGFGIEIVARGQSIHAVELIDVAVKFVRSAARDDIHDRSGIAPE